MPVEFFCPHCRAKMRTPDDAMGRETGCPGCQGRLTVPTIEIPPPEPIATLVSDDPAAPLAVTPPREIPMVTPSETGNPFDFAAADATPAPATSRNSSTEIDATTSYKRRKKKSGWGVLAAVAVVAAVALGGAAFLMSQGTPELNGSVTGIVTPGDGATASVDLPEGVSSERLVAELRREPVVLRTALYDTSIGADDGKVVVTVSRTGDGEMFEVDLTADAAMASFLASNGAAFADRRAGRLASDANMLAVNAGTDPVDREAVIGFQESVGLASLQNTLGPHVVAEVNNTGYPVISEPKPGVVRWILPKGTTQFSILRNPSNDGGLPPTFEYDVTVNP